MDRIEIHGLRVMTVVGVLDHEREAPQPLQLDLVLHVDLADASISDELADTANYGSVSEAVADVVRESKDLLLERVAGRVCEVLLDFDRVEAVDVTVTKLRPPIPEDVQSSSVTLHRQRPRQGCTDPPDAIAPSSPSAPTSATARATSASPSTSWAPLAADVAGVRDRPDRRARRAGAVPQHGRRRRHVARPVRVPAPLPADRGRGRPPAHRALGPAHARCRPAVLRRRHDHLGRS